MTRPPGAEPVQRPERDQAVTGSDVQQRVVGLQRRPVQHLVTDPVQRRDHLLAVAGIAAMPDVKQPTDASDPGLPPSAASLPAVPLT